MIRYKGKDIEYNDLPSKYTDYALKIKNGDVPSCEYLKLAVNRFLKWFERDDMYFDCDAVDKVEKFVNKLTHFSGQFNGKPFLLLDWQFFIVENIFGWKYNETGLRVTKRAYCEITRKCGKSALVSALMLYMMIGEGEGEAQVGCVAPSYKQAQLIFEMSSKYIGKLDPKNKIFKRLREELKMPCTNSWLKCFAAVPDKLDGWGMSSASIDEIEEIKTPELYNVIVSGMGARSQPVIFCIGTAGFHKEYWYYKQRESNIENLMLEKDDGTFSVIYTIDKGDDWEDEKVWIKAIPSLKTKENPNGTVNINYIRDQIDQAKNVPALRNGVLTKNLNVWCDAEHTWIPNEYMCKASDKNIKLEDFRGMTAFVGLDLSSVSDLTTVSVMIPLDNKFYFFNYIFLPSETIELSQNRQMYKYWRDTGQLIVTEGNCQDINVILNKIKEIGNIVNIQSIEYDSWGSTQLTVNAVGEGLPMHPCSQSIGNFSRGHKMLERLILEGNAVIQDNEIVRWNFSNIIVKEDLNGNCKGQKNFDEPDKKIDTYISMCECLLGFLDSPMGQYDIFSLNY